MRARPSSPCWGPRLSSAALLPSALGASCAGEVGHLSGLRRCTQLDQRRPPLCCSLAKLASSLESSFPRLSGPFSVVAERATPKGLVAFFWGGSCHRRLGEYIFIYLLAWRRIQPLWNILETLPNTVPVFVPLPVIQGR